MKPWIYRPGAAGGPWRVRIKLPRLAGDPIRVRFRPELTRHGNRLLSGQGTGAPVHAATFIGRRLMILESALRSNRRDLRRVFTHELFHFVWVRIGNPRRFGFERLLAGEFRRRARGELGWSAEMRKQRLRARDLGSRSRRWRDYCCESFCDTAAWLYSGVPRHPEYTLAARWRAERRAWFTRAVTGAGISI